VLISLGLSSPPTKDYVTISFTNLEVYRGKSMYFKVNGEIILIDSKKHKIKIDPKSLDTIAFCHDSSSQSCYSFYLTKFISGQAYKIKIENEHFYSLSADSKSREGRVRFKTTNCTDTLAAIMGSSHISYQLSSILPPNSVTDYLQKDTSEAYYEFARTELIFANKDCIANPGREKSWLSEEGFYFLHGELLTISYDGKTKKITVTLDGYAK
jgi:hypothetical protein